MDYKEQNRKTKKEILDFLQEGKNVFLRIRDNNTSESIDKIISDFEHNAFSIVVVGQFSAGKSTFLNALMGKKYLPSFSTETTATVNFLKSINESPTGKPLIVINYNDGSNCVEEVSLENIERYVSTRGENVAKNIASVELFLDSKFLNDGVSLVDSPGLNGVLEGHAQITNRQIDVSHAALFIVDRAPKETDFKTLKRLMEKCPRIFILLNQIDSIHSDEGDTPENLVEKLKERFHEFFPNTTLPEIYPISARLALAGRDNEFILDGKKSRNSEENAELIRLSRIEALEERLFRYLVCGEKTKEEYRTPVKKVKSFLETQKAILENEVEELNNSTDSVEIQRQIDVLSSELLQLNQKIGNGRKDIGVEVRQLLADAKDAIIRGTKDLRQNYIQRINGNSAESDLDVLFENSSLYVSQMIAEYNNVIYCAMKELESDFRNAISVHISQYTDEIEENLNKNIFDESMIGQHSIVLDTSKFDIDVNIDEQMEIYNEIKRKMDANQADIENQEIQMYKVERDSRKREKKEKNIAQLNDQRLQELISLGPRPKPESIQISERSKPGGVKGFFVEIWNGNQGEFVTTTIIDDSNRVKYDQQKEEIERRYNSEISRLELELNSISDEDSAVYRSRLEMLEKKKQRLEEDLREFEERKRQKIEKTRRKQTGIAVNYVDECMTKIDQEYRKDVLESLDSMRKIMSEIVSAIVEDGVADAINKKEQELKTRKENLSASLEERQKIIQEKEEMIKDIADICNKGMDICKSLDGEADVIKMEN